MPMPAVVSEVCDLGYGKEVKCRIKLILCVFCVRWFDVVLKK